jgi:hypothetical protein
VQGKLPLKVEEASQSCEQKNESRGETLLPFRGFQRKNGRTKSSEEISRSSVGCWILRRCKESYGGSVQKILSSGA